MHRSTWKRRERDAARLFGAKRQPLSGSSGRDDLTRSDSDHPTLFIETKTRKRHTVRTLWEDVRNRARKENKTPVLALFDAGKIGGLIVIHQDDLAKLAELIDRNGATGNL